MVGPHSAAAPRRALAALAQRPAPALALGGIGAGLFLRYALGRPDVVAALAIVGALLTGEYLAGAVIVLMQSGGEALEAYGVRRASATLAGLLARAPRRARRHEGAAIAEIPVEDVAVGD